ncbi:MAG: hypothetical protein K8S87_01620 [Planctomycetes bacterium]|nr:hypothetical protein [Planctomycetota bacterium]
MKSKLTPSILICTIAVIYLVLTSCGEKNQNPQQQNVIVVKYCKNPK